MLLSARRPARAFVAASTSAHSHASPDDAAAAWPAIQRKAACSDGSGTVLRARIVGSVQISMRAAASVAAKGRMHTTPSDSTGRAWSGAVMTEGYVTLAMP